MVSIQFLGAAGTVTGSKHLLKTPQKNILIDCGLFQGLKSLRLKNWELFPVDVRDIDLVILTHAHLDHCGYLPLLVKSGYSGRILMTPPTRDLAEIVLLDSGHIQEEDAERANRHGYSKHKPAKPLYTVKDAEKAIKLFVPIEDNVTEVISPDINFRFIQNGHILGSAFIDMNCHGKKIVFTGDMGRSNSELMKPPTVISGCDYLVMESTYGDRNHGEASSKDQLADVINETAKSNGNLLIPSFAIGRAQELMHLINELKSENSISEMPVYMDSPMGASATRVLGKYPNWHKLTPQESNDIFNNVKIISEFKDTRRAIEDDHIKIVIAASGMLTGGRVLEYLREYVGDKRNTILLVGYQAEGTRGRQLKNGADEIKVYGKFYKVNAKVSEISGLSAHADQGEMLAWLKKFTQKPQRIFLVHGEDNSRNIFSEKIKNEIGVEVILPNQNDEITLF